MRRTDILHSIEVLRKALTSTSLPEALRNHISSRGEGRRANLLPQLNAYSILASHFDETTNELVEIFELQLLSNASVWDDLLENESVGQVHSLFSDVRTAIDTLPKFAKLLEQKGEGDYFNALPAAMRAKENFGTVSVILLENEKEFSKPERLIEVLQAVTELYQGLARISDESTDNLTVLSCDSGSDKSFDFLGAAKIIEQFKELIIALWDRIVYFGPKRQEAELDVIIKSLPILEKMSEMEASDHLGPELAEIIRRQIEGGIRKFVHAGATIPEIRDHTYHEPRSLMSPEKKLLMPPPIADTPPSAPPPKLDLGGQAEQDVMKEMLARLERMEQQQKTATKRKPPRRQSR